LASKASAAREPILSPRRGWLTPSRCHWLLRGARRTFSPFHHGAVTTFTLEVGAAGDGDNRDHSFSAFRAARCSIHEILRFFTRNRKLELLFHGQIYGRGGFRGTAVDCVMINWREHPSPIKSRHWHWAHSVTPLQSISCGHNIIAVQSARRPDER
jgi:hypothetical protein